MNFLFKNRDFAHSALSLAGGMLVVSIFSAARAKGNMAVAGLTFGLPLGVLIFWLTYSLRLAFSPEQRQEPEEFAASVPTVIRKPLLAHDVVIYRTQRPRSHQLFTGVYLDEETRVKRLLGRDPAMQHDQRRVETSHEWPR